MGNPTRIKAAVPGEPPRCALTKSRPRGAKARAAGREHVNQTHHPPPVPERLRAIEEYEQQVADASVTIGEIYALWQGTAEILARIDLRALTRKLRPEV